MDGPGITLIDLQKKHGKLFSYQVLNQTLHSMTTGELIHIYESATHNKASIFGVPGGALKPVEAAGELIKRFGHQGALEEASRKTGNSPAPWNFWYQVYCVLSNTTP